MRSSSLLVSWKEYDDASPIQIVDETVKPVSSESSLENLVLRQL